MYPLSPVAHLTAGCLFVEAAIQVQTFENKLDGRRNTGRISTSMKLINSFAQTAHSGKLVDVLHRGHIVAYLHAQPALETGHQLVELARVKVVPEDAEDGGVEQFLDDTLFLDIADGIKLDLAAGRSDDARKVAHARGDIAFAQAQRAAVGIAQHVLVVGDRDAHTDAGTLADIAAATRQLCKFGNDFLHELRINHIQLIRWKGCAFGLHDLHFVFYRARIVRANLGADAVFERRDNAAAIGVVFRVGAGDHIDIQRQANLVAANLHIALFHDVQQAHLDALGKVGQFVDAEDATIRARNHAVVDGQFVGEVAAFGNAHGINLAHQVRDGDIGRRQLLAIAAITRQPGNLYIVSTFLYLIAASLTDRLVGIIVDLATGNDRHFLIQQADKRARHAGLCLPALAQENDVLARENGVFNLRNNGLFIADNAGEKFFPIPNLLYQVFSHFLLNREDPISTFTQFANRAWSSTDRHSILCYLSRGAGYV